MFLRILRILKYCCSKIVYVAYYHNVAQSFLVGESSAFRRTPKSLKHYSEDISESIHWLKNFKKVFKEDEINEEKGNNFLFRLESRHAQNLKSFLCIYSIFFLQKQIIIQLISFFEERNQELFGKLQKHLFQGQRCLNRKQSNS